MDSLTTKIQTSESKIKLDLRRWCESYVKLETGIPFSLTQYPYLHELYAEHHIDTTIEKCAQIGISSLVLFHALWACDTLGLRVIYFFPTDVHVRLFSNTRARPIIRYSDYLSALIARDQIDNVSVRQIRNGFLWFLGMRTDMQTRSTPADMLIFDELDEADPVSAAKAEYRLAHSEYKWIKRLSTPSFPDYGIDVDFQKSDQRYWLLKCPRCNYWNSLETEWPDNVMVIGDTNPVVMLMCYRCHDVLDVVSCEGQWVAKSPHIVDKRGYHMCTLYSPRTSIAKCWERWNSTQPGVKSEFIRQGLGIPYVEAKDRVAVVTVMACGADYAEHIGGTQLPGATMGVDQGSILHYRISVPDPDGSGKRKVLRIDTCDTFGELYTLMRDYDIRRCCIDELPNQHSARDFAVAFPGRVYMVHYNTSPRDKNIAPVWNDNTFVVSVHRTASMDATKEEFNVAAPRVILPLQSPKLVEFAKHCFAVVKKEETDNDTGERYWHYVRTGPDHWFHASNYDRIAYSAFNSSFLSARIDPMSAVHGSSSPVRSGGVGITSHLVQRSTRPIDNSNPNGIVRRGLFR